jgi:hypothetical protein
VRTVGQKLHFGGEPLSNGWIKEFRHITISEFSFGVILWLKKPLRIAELIDHKNERHSTYGTPGKFYELTSIGISHLLNPFR